MKYKKARCKNCGNWFPKTKKERVYCGIRCNARFRYNKLKNNREFRRKNTENSRRWRKKNREHFNDLVRPKSKKYQRRIRIERKKKRLCPYCGKRKPTKGYVSCSKCRKKRGERWNKR